MIIYLVYPLLANVGAVDCLRIVVGNVCGFARLCNGEPILVDELD